MLELNQVHQGDCLELMRDIDSESIDMILADLPYGTTACSWDTIIPLKPLWEQYKRIVKPRGAIVLTASQPFTSVLVSSNIEWFRVEWVWKKSHATGQLNASYRPMLEHESILVFSAGKTTYNPQYTKKPSRDIRPPSRMGMSDCYGTQREYKRSISIDQRNPTTVIEFSNVNRGEAAGHPTQKPVALFQYLIRTYSNEGETILDNTAGSCTTAIAAIRTSRQWICIEKEPEYVQIGRDRITKELQQPSFFTAPQTKEVFEQQSLL